MENIERDFEDRINAITFKAKLQSACDELKTELIEMRSLRDAINATMQSKIDNLLMKIRIYTQEIVKFEREEQENRRRGN